MLSGIDFLCLSFIKIKKTLDNRIKGKAKMQLIPEVSQTSLHPQLHFWPE